MLGVPSKPDSRTAGGGPDRSVTGRDTGASFQRAVDHLNDALLILDTENGPKDAAAYIQMAIERLAQGEAP